MGRSLAVLAYLGLSELAMGPAERIVQRRLSEGKEDPGRWPERLGRPSQPRPEGPLVWFHAASVGEAMSVLDLIELLVAAREDLHILITTGTVTSAEMLAERLPERVIHQYVPVDAARAVRRFLRHWKPDAAVWTESELWPALMHHTKRTGAPMYLLNARISAKSARRMRYLGSFASSLFARFTKIMAQDVIVAERLLRLGCPASRIEITGSLKEAASALPADDNVLKELGKQFTGKQLWCAASTHPGEEEIVINAHRQARRTYHGLILILVPRHPGRGNEIARMLRNQGWHVAQRSAGEVMERETEVYLADTMGELGYWYRLAPVSFIGGSLVEIGGHNPFEPAMLGSAILHGPYVDNFESVYTRFDLAEACVLVPSPGALAAKLVETLPPDRTAQLAAAAWEVTSEGANIAVMLRDELLAAIARREG